jgi:hypothetical protein
VALAALQSLVDPDELLGLDEKTPTAQSVSKSAMQFLYIYIDICPTARPIARPTAIANPAGPREVIQLPTKSFDSQWAPNLLCARKTGFGTIFLNRSRGSPGLWSARSYSRLTSAAFLSSRKATKRESFLLCEHRRTQPVCLRCYRRWRFQQARHCGQIQR